MKLNLIIEKNCALCARVQARIEKLVNERDDFELEIFDIEKQNGFNAQIVPSLFVEDRLFAIGEFDVEKLKGLAS